MSRISFGPIDSRPMNSNRTMPIMDTRAWLSIRHTKAGQHPVMQALRHGDTITPLELAALIPGLATADWQIAGGFASDLARELATRLGDLQVNLILSGPDSHKLPWEQAEPELRGIAQRLSEELASPSDAAAEIWTVNAGDRAFTVFVRADRGWWASENIPTGEAHRVSKVLAVEGPSPDVEAAVRTWALTVHPTVRISRR